MFHSHSKDLTYFDIRLKSRGLNNAILVNGNEAETENIPVEGHVKISSKNDLHIKRVKLQLVGEFAVDFYSSSKDGFSAGQITQRNCVLKVVWPNLLCSPHGEIHYGDYSDSAVKYHKADNLGKRSLENSSLDLTSAAKEDDGKPKRPSFHKTKSQPTLFKNQEPSLFKIPRSGVDGTPYPLTGRAKNEAHSFLLPNGNYSMPFSIYLPGNLPESVEGLKEGKIRYKLECFIERGRFDRAMKTARHIRIIRTLHPQNLNLSDSIEFLNTWPEKMEFKVSLPKKALAVGATVPIKLVVVPLIKGLSFKSMYAEIIQRATVGAIWAKSQPFEVSLGKTKVACDKTAITEDNWILQGMYQVPSSLNEITQTCALKSDLINVKHVVRVTIHIRNADGHISELRAHLPVVVYLSPHKGRILSRHLEIDSSGQFTSEPDPKRDDVVLAKAHEIRSEENSDNDEESEEDSRGDSAPPVYDQHKNDMVYDYTSPRTPLEQLRAHGPAAAIDSYFDIAKSKSLSSSPADLSKLLQIPCYEEALEEDSDDNGEMPAPTYFDDSPAKSPTPISVTLNKSFGNSRSSSMPAMAAKETLTPNRRKVLFMRKEVKIKSP